MKKILITGAERTGKTTLATLLAKDGDSLHTFLDGVKASTLLDYKNIVIDEVYNVEILKVIFKQADRLKDGKIIVTTTKDLDESLFDNVFRLK